MTTTETPTPRTPNRQDLPTEFPLLAYLAGELTSSTGLDDRAAVLTAQQLLEEAFASVDRNPARNA